MAEVVDYIPKVTSTRAVLGEGPKVLSSASKISENLRTHESDVLTPLSGSVQTDRPCQPGGSGRAGALAAKISAPKRLSRPFRALALPGRHIERLPE